MALAAGWRTRQKGQARGQEPRQDDYTGPGREWQRLGWQREAREEGRELRDMGQRRQDLRSEWMGMEGEGERGRKNAAEFLVGCQVVSFT